jgi:hypothetical protein
MAAATEATVTVLVIEVTRRKAASRWARACPADARVPVGEAFEEPTCIPPRVEVHPYDGMTANLRNVEETRSSGPVLMPS